MATLHSVGPLETSSPVSCLNSHRNTAELFHLSAVKPVPYCLESEWYTYRSSVADAHGSNPPKFNVFKD